MTRTQEIIEKFVEQGYIRSSPILLRNIRVNNQKLNGIHIKIFAPSSGGHRSHGSIKYTSMDILGERYAYYFDVERKEKFVDYLVEKFYKKNPNPERGLKSAFTRLLHLHGLRWSDEYVGRNKRNL
jgi:hypothetical protein